MVYVSGRKRPADESNGKSGNLNNALSQIYPDSCKIPGNEVVCIMDADQVGPALCDCCPAICMQLLVDSIPGLHASASVPAQRTAARPFRTWCLTFCSAVQ